MNIDDSLNNCFTPEEVARIRKRVVVNRHKAESRYYPGYGRKGSKLNL